MGDLNDQLASRPPPFVTPSSTHRGTGISSPFLMAELKRALASVKPWSTPGEDALPYYILKLAPIELLSHIQHPQLLLLHTPMEASNNDPDP